MDYTKLGITPIDEQSPSGKDVKYDEDFELIESEMSKLTSPSSSNEIDWDIVSKVSSNILETKSKHLLVAVYLSYALYKLRGIDGLNDGVMVIADILDNYWETLYPPKKRLKGRINAIEWWLGKLAKDIDAMDIVVASSEKKQSIITNLKRADEFLNGQIDDSPLFFKLINIIDTKLQTKIEESQEKEMPKEVKKPVEQRVESKSQPSKTLSSNVEDDFKNTVESLNILVGQMIEVKDYRAELFMLNRASLWLDIDSVPKSEKNVTMLPPPDAQEIELLNSLYKDKNYEALLFSAESRTGSYLFWLDLHYFVAESLRHLEHQEASQVVHEQALYFIKKLPNLQNLSFSDSMPFASKVTKKWLKPQELKVQTTQTQKIDIDIKDDSIDVLNQRMNSALSVQEEVFYNIKICELLLKVENETLTYTYAHKLLDTLKRYKTSRWNPDIALKAYSVCLESIKMLDNDSDSELLSSLLRRIALLKPSLIDDIS